MYGHIHIYKSLDSEIYYKKKIVRLIVFRLIKGKEKILKVKEKYIMSSLLRVSPEKKYIMKNNILVYLKIDKCNKSI